MNYNIKKYFMIRNNDGSCIVQNGITTMLITHGEIIQLLYNLEKQRKKEISHSDLLLEFNSRGDECITFLVENKLLEVVNKRSIDLNEIRIFSNNNGFIELSKISFSDMSKVRECESINDFVRNFRGVESKIDPINIFFLNPFDKEIYLDISNKLSELNAISIGSFFYNHSLYISNIAKKDWCNPCLKCFYYSLETQLSMDRSYGKFNFGDLVKILYEKNCEFAISAPLEKHDYLDCMVVIRDQLKKIKNGVKTNNCYEISLSKNVIRSESPAHWNLCDCYE